MAKHLVLEGAGAGRRARAPSASPGRPPPAADRRGLPDLSLSQPAFPAGSRGIEIPTRTEPHIDLEELDTEGVVVRIAATPRSDDDGARLADALLAVVGLVISDAGNPS